MNKLIIFFALAAVVVAEPPVNYGAPQAYTYNAPSSGYSSSGGYDSGNDGSSYVDDALLARIAQILEQNEGSYSRQSSGGYSAPSSSYGAPPSSGYGAPTRSAGVRLGRPEVAQRVAEFDLTETRSSGGYSHGGYN